MTSKNSQARKIFWASKTKDYRTAHASKMAIALSKKMTKKQRTKKAKKMAKARWAKYRLLNNKNK